jgi:hypothetical protein
VKGSLASDFLPQPAFSEVHSIDVSAPAGVILNCIDSYDPFASGWPRLAITLRDLPAWLFDRAGGEPFGKHTFLPLGRRGENEIAFGLAGRFWRPDLGLTRCGDVSEFAAWAEPGTAKLVISFLVTGDAASVTLTTETRIACFGSAARQKMALYWIAIRPVSGAMRLTMLRAIKRQAEAHDKLD